VKDHRQQKTRDAIQQPFEFHAAFPQGFEGFGLVIQHGLAVKPHLFSDFRGRFLFKKVKAQDRLALAWQFIYLLHDGLEELRFGPLGLQPGLVDAGVEIGQVLLALFPLGAGAKVVNGFIASYDVQPTLDMLVGFLLKLLCFLYPLSMAMALIESSVFRSRSAACSIRW